MEIKKLNFGCGEDIKSGWDNVDIQKSPRIMKSFDFDKFPYPLKENTYDYVYTNSVLEHLKTPDKTLHELWRVCKPGAIIEIIVPHYGNKSSYSNFQHRYHFSDTTFIIFVNEITVINKNKKFEIVEMENVPSIVGKFMPKKLREKLSLFVGGLISYVHVKLRILKK